MSDCPFLPGIREEVERLGELRAVQESDAQAGFLPRAAGSRGSGGAGFFLYRGIPWDLTCSTNEKCFLVRRCEEVSRRRCSASDLMT